MTLTIMKKTILFFAILSSSYCMSYAQVSAIKESPNPENYKEFFKMSQTRFLENISQTTAVLEKESARIKLLNNLDDSLLAKGEITDSTSRLYKGKLAQYQRQNDSLTKLCFLFLFFFAHLTAIQVDRLPLDHFQS